MKAKILILLITFFSSFIFGQEYKTLTSDGKLRKGRNILSNVITTISEGSKVEIIYNSHEKGYFRVIYKDRAGYIHERHFEVPNTYKYNSNDAVGQVIFQEDFNNNRNKWRESKSPSKDFFFKNGEYFIIQRDAGRLTWESKNIQINTGKDFSIEASVTLHMKRNGGAHLMYGIDEDNHNYYSVKIKNEKGKKEAFIGKFINGQWVGTWKDAIVNNFGRPNTIQIIKKDRIVNFYINNILIDSQTFTPFFGNHIGLGCEGIQSSSFDYLTIQQGPQNFPVEQKITPTQREVVVYNSATSIKLDKYNGVYTIPVGLNEVLQINGIFENGASNITLSSDAALTLIKTGTIGNNDWINGPSFDLPDGSVAVSNKFKLRSLSIGNKTIYNVTCSISSYMKVPMILGKNILNRFGKYSFNYADEILTLGGN